MFCFTFFWFYVIRRRFTPEKIALCTSNSEEVSFLLLLFHYFLNVVYETDESLKSKVSKKRLLFMIMPFTQKNFWHFQYTKSKLKMFCKSDTFFIKLVETNFFVFCKFAIKWYFWLPILHSLCKNFIYQTMVYTFSNVFYSLLLIFQGKHFSLIYQKILSK